MTFILLIALIMSGGVSLVSQSALPGDTLYPVKVHINENVRGAFSLSEESKAALDVDRVETRLIEAEKLAAEGKLDGDIAVRVEENFDAYAKRAHERIARLEANDHVAAAADIGSGLEASLRAHERILTQLGKEKQAIAGPIKELATRVRVERDASASARIAAEQKVSVGAETEARGAAEGKLQAAQNVLQEVRRFVEQDNKEFSAEATAEAEAQLKIADETIVAGRAKLSANAYGEAFVLFQKAMRLAQEAKALVSARTDFDLKVDLKASGSASGSTTAEESTKVEGEGSSKGSAGTQSGSGASAQGSAGMEASGSVKAGSGSGANASGGVQVHVGI